MTQKQNRTVIMMSDTATPFHPSLIGGFVFDDELCFAQDAAQETVDGYLMATDVLVSRMLYEVQKTHTADELETLENINFYPVYNLVTNRIHIDGTYWYWRAGEEEHGSFMLPLSEEETADLTQAFEGYCIKQNGKSCKAMLNAFRAEDGLPSVDALVAMKGIAEKVPTDLQQEYGIKSETQKNDVPRGPAPSEQSEENHTITRSSGIPTGLGYIVGGGYKGFSQALDDAVKHEAELLRKHYKADVTIRFNSDRLSGGAWLVDAVDQPLFANSSIGLGAQLVNRKLFAMSIDQKFALPHHEFEDLRRNPDMLQFTTAIDLEKTHHTVSPDSKHILQNREYRIFPTLNEAVAYLFAHVASLREEYKRKEPLESRIQAASEKSDHKAPTKDTPHLPDIPSRA